MDEKGKKFIIGIYEDEDILLDAISSVKDKGVNIYEVYSPFPVHGIENKLGYKRSRLSIAAFCFGFIGLCLALTMMIGMMTIDWPMIIGGKDFLPLPVFIPVTFEMTVLLSAFGMVGTFFVVSDLKPWGIPKTFDLRSTDDKHVMAIEIEKNQMKEVELKKLLVSNGASETSIKVMDV
ncbi:MAG: DUF3341 domain-containing protein [Bacteroidota bacterium]|nr:DUF3341 domain-containing protein [Bacteroidota bacterium]